MSDDRATTDSEECRESVDEIVLGNGDTLTQRLDKIDLDSEECCSTEEMRDRFW
ncbi:MAG: hypothetical protein ABEI99_05475 [Halobaculum sp.]